MIYDPPTEDREHYTCKTTEEPDGNTYHDPGSWQEWDDDMPYGDNPFEHYNDNDWS